MNARVLAGLPALSAATGVLCLALLLSSDSLVCATGEPGAPPDEGRAGVTVAEARAQAKLMHGIYAATLDTMHHHFFRRDRSVLPARAMEDVFDEMERRSGIRAGWISVNTKAMSVHHEPKNDFEKQAARAIAAGKAEYELVEKGYYHRAEAIPLGGACVSCHTGFFSKAPQTQRFAGLVISVPIDKK